MATWGLHLRVAEELLKKEFLLDEVSFAVGNIGPDCGVPNEDWSQFSPPTEISHWSDNRKKNIDSQGFFDTHLLTGDQDMLKSSFLWGYYVHLLTDIEWRKKVERKKGTDKNYSLLNSDKKFIWTIKKDWYDLDRVYFRDNPDSIFHRLFKQVRDFPDYLDYYPPGAVIRQVRYITAFYEKPKENLDREYEYLTMDEMDDFIEQTVDIIWSDIEQRLN